MYENGVLIYWSGSSRDATSVVATCGATVAATTTLTADQSLHAFAIFHTLVNLHYQRHTNDSESRVSDLRSLLSLWASGSELSSNCARLQHIEIW